MTFGDIDLAAQENTAVALDDSGQVVATQNAPDIEGIPLNPEALRVRRQAVAYDVIGRAVDFIRRQPQITRGDLLAHKQLKEAVEEFNLVSYELQLQETLVKLQQHAEDRERDSVVQAEETPPVSESEPVQQEEAVPSS